MHDNFYTQFLQLAHIQSCKNKNLHIEYNVFEDVILMNINLETIMQVAVPLLTIILGALSAYLRANNKLRDRSLKYIVEAEELYKDYTKAGGRKFSWVVDTLYDLIPAPLKMIVTKNCIEKIVQSSFDSIEEYAKMQLDSAAEKYLKSLNDEKSEDILDSINEELGDKNA